MPFSLSCAEDLSSRSYVPGPGDRDRWHICLCSKADAQRVEMASPRLSRTQCARLSRIISRKHGTDRTKQIWPRAAVAHAHRNCTLRTNTQRHFHPRALDPHDNARAIPDIWFQPRWFRLGRHLRRRAHAALISHEPQSVPIKDLRRPGATALYHRERNAQRSAACSGRRDQQRQDQDKRRSYSSKGAQARSPPDGQVQDSSTWLVGPITGPHTN